MSGSAPTQGSVCCATGLSRRLLRFKATITGSNMQKQLRGLFRAQDGWNQTLDPAKACNIEGLRAAGIVIALIHF
jgi:hypothetical protein